LPAYNVPVREGMKAVTALALVTIVTVVTVVTVATPSAVSTKLPIEGEGGYLHTAVIPTIGKFAQGNSR
jgi:hypothetical protein